MYVCMYVCMYVSVWVSFIEMCFSYVDTGILFVCRYGDLALLEWLVRQTKECGDVDLENQYGDTALALACRLGQLEMVTTYIYI